MLGAYKCGCLNPLDLSRGGLYVVKTVLTPVEKISEGFIMTRYVSSITLRDVGFGVGTPILNFRVNQDFPMSLDIFGRRHGGFWS